MRRIIAVLCLVILIIPELSIFSLVAQATQNSYTDIKASTEVNSNLMIPSGYPSYPVEGDGLDISAKFTYAYFDENPGVRLYNAVEEDKRSDNGYILIYEKDIAAWIGHYGRTTNPDYVSHILSLLNPIEVRVGSDKITFYNHAKVAQYSGGSPGEFYFSRKPNGNYEGRVRYTKLYNREFPHSINLSAPTTAVAGEPVTLTMSTTEGSVFFNQAQKWDLTISGPDGTIQKLNKYSIMPTITDRRAVHQVTHTFRKSGTYTIQFSIEDTSYHSDERTGTSQYSVTKQVNVQGDLRANFDVEPSTIRYGDSFKLKPRDIEIPAGRTIQRIEYTIYSPDRSRLHRITTSTDAERRVLFSEYPSFFSSTANQTYPITMILTDSTGEKTPVVEKSLSIRVNDLHADFEIQPGSVLSFRDSFSFVPTDIQTGSLTYKFHRFRIQRDGLTYTTEPIYGITKGASFTYATYPYVMSVGSHDVEIEVVTEEGPTTGWVSTKPLTLTNPRDNSPPVFEVGWVYPWDLRTPVYQVVQGQTMHLIYIFDPTKPTPYDPDGDDFYFLGFDFSSSSAWGKTIPSNYTEYIDGYRNVKMDTLGTHSARGTMRDSWGASSTRTAVIHVIPPNPIPVAGCPQEIKEMRPVDPAWFDSRKSYSPLGKKIDHSRDEWTNVKDMYVNGTMENKTLTASLHVYDIDGLKSIDPAQCTFTLLPDLPPIGELDVPPLAIRGQVFDVFNVSYSPDGDPLVSAEYRYKYDANYNGFQDESWIPVAGTLTKTQLTPTKIGKYLFDVKVCEDYGKCAWASETQPESLRIVDVINLAPTVSFEMEGENKQPAPNQTIPYSAESIFANWQLYDVNTNTQVKYKGESWHVENGALIGGTGKRNERQYYTYASGKYFGGHEYSYLRAYPFNDYGFGMNNLNPYRASGAYSYKTALLIEEDGDSFGITYSRNYMPTFRSNRTYIYFDSQGQWDNGRYDYVGGKIFAMNKEKIGSTRRETEWFNASFYWDEGSPYDFIIDIRQVEQLNRPIEPILLGYEMTDRTIYAMIQYDNLRTEIATFDAFTGEFIARSGDLHWDKWEIYSEINRIQMMNAIGKNDHLLLFSANQNEVYELNRNAELVRETTLNRRPVGQYRVGDTIFSCSRAPTPIYRTDDGGFYQYEYEDCYHPQNRNVYQNTYIVKFKADLSLHWRRKLIGDMPFYGTCDRGFGDNTDDFTVVFHNPTRNSIIARSYTYPGWLDCEFYAQEINLSNGTVIRNIDRSQESLYFDAYTSRMSIDWDGNITRVDGNSEYLKAIVTGERYITNMSEYDGRYNEVPVYAPHNEIRQGYIGGGGQVGFWDKSSGLLYSGYFGDGVFITLFNFTGYMDAWYSYSAVPFVSKAEPTSVPPRSKTFKLGQFVSGTTLDDSELSFQLRMEDVDHDDELVGMSFRMRDPRNRYAVETNGRMLYLSKYVNGTRTILKSINYPFQDKTEYSFRITMQGNQLDVSLNGVPYLAATDSTYASGRFGPFSDKSYIQFKGIASKKVMDPAVHWLSNYAIWEEGSASATVKYLNILFEDPENDPRAGSYEWTYQHTPRFLNHQGVSALHGQTYSSERLSFDKVGDYVVTLKARDDPYPSAAYRYPNMVIDSYRRSSNAFQNKITVHRRPVAQFTLSIHADKTVRWNDTSYDPDRWLSPTHYSTEDTGIDYRTTRGILERKYYYITPSGRIVNEMLVAPTEAGTYTVGLSVKDEYGAWSYWTERTIQIVSPAPPDEPPKAGFTMSKYTAYRGETITITSTASDKEDGPSRNLRHEYFAQNINGGPEYVQCDAQGRCDLRESWTKVFSTLGSFNFRQVVYDSKGQTAQAMRQIQIVNRIPVTQVTIPSATTAANPTVFKVSQPTISWTYTDADQDPQQRFRVIIRNAGTGQLILQSGDIPSDARSWQVSVPLAEDIVYSVETQVFDGFDWSQVSSKKYMTIILNTPPVADFDWTPKPVWEGDRVFLLNRSFDPDGDPLTYVWQIQQPDGATRTYTTYQPDMLFIVPGTYLVTLQASDHRTSSSVTKPIFANRLTIDPDVFHTAEWQQYHEAAGHNISTHPKDFYAGEKLLLEARASPAPVKQVRASIRTTGIDGSELRTETVLSLSEVPDVFTGILYDERWLSLTEGLPKGQHTVSFEIQYANGVTKSATIPIQIIGNALSTSGVHRRR